MGKGNRIIVFILFSLFSFTCKPKQTGTDYPVSLDLDINKFSWIMGAWSGGENGDLLFQCWSRKNDSLIQAENLIIVDSDTLFYHDIFIHKTEQAILLKTRPRAEFEMPSQYHIMVNNNGEHVFENKEKDFPQRIIFVLNTDGSLYYRLEGTFEGQPQYQDFTLYKSK